MFLLSWLGSLVLFLLGWNDISEYIIKALHDNKKCILVYPHTSNWDFVILFFYTLKYSTYKRRSDLVVLVKPQMFSYFGAILQKFGCIPAARLEDRGTGNLDQIKQKLNNRDFIFMISPKGKRDLGEWRKGYFYLAKEFRCPIIPLGLNYCTHSVQMGAPCMVEDESNEADIRWKLQDELKFMTPYNPDKSEYILDEYNGLELGILSIERLAVYFGMSIIAYLYSRLFLILIFGIISIVSRRLSIQYAMKHLLVR